MTDKAGLIANRFGIPEKNVSNLLSLLDEGSTIPFIARYRKESTGGLDEVTIKEISNAYEQLDQLDKRKKYVLSVIRDSGRLTQSLEEEIEKCEDLNRLEDIYLPFKPKRRTRASVARENGLEPLAGIIMSQKSRDVESIARRFVKGDVHSVPEALDGAKDIMAEWIAENKSNRNRIRNSVNRHGLIKVKGDASQTKYADYTGYASRLATISAHAFLAIQRAENEKILKMTVETDEEYDISSLSGRIIRNDCSEKSREIILDAIKDSYKRLLKPSIVTEALNDVKERSDRQSIELFAGSLRQILLYPPVAPSDVLAIDPGFRTGCKIACLDSVGKLLEHDVIYPVPPVNKKEEAALKIKKLLKRYDIKLIALGDGTASRETERFIRGLGPGDDVKVVRVSEQGASIYSASEVARKEFPDLDLTFRSAVSIGRRLQDPLAELVKIDPKSIGVGQYQHDVNQKQLKDALDFTVSRCVNEVGVNINTASANLLSYVSGIGDTMAERIVAYRNENGVFKSRKELLNIPRFGQKAFEQSSGFIRVPDSPNPLDNSAVHPESYPIVERMARKLGVELKELIGNEMLISEIVPEDFVTANAGTDTINDIISELRQPGRDPRQAREDDWRDLSIESIDDVKVGMRLKGKVVNLTAFGAFVDLGIKTNGLLHVSKIVNRRISSPADVLKIYQIVDVTVIEVDLQRSRISLSMI